MKKLWNFFASIRLTIALVILICAVAAWGSVLSMRHPEFYGALDRQVLFPWLFSAGKEYIGYTFWIYALVYLTSIFALNTVVCTVDRVYRVFAAKKPWQSLFAQLVHVGFLVALLGHLAGSVWGFRSYGNIVFMGDLAPVPHNKGLFVRLDGLEVKPSPSGDLESLKTTVTLIKDSRPVLTDEIRLNDPLVHNGMAFYHFDQGSTPSGLNLEVGGVKVAAGFNKNFQAGGGSYRLGEIYPDFAVDGSGNPYSRSEEFLNPHIEIIAEGGQKAYLDISRPGTEAALEAKSVRFVDFIITPYVILTINKDPGIWFIIAGSAILVAGMVLLLFFRGERSELVRKKA